MNKKSYVGIFVALFVAIAILVLPLTQVKAEDNGNPLPGSQSTAVGQGNSQGNGNSQGSGQYNAEDNTQAGLIAGSNSQLQSENMQPSVSINPQGQTKLNNASVTAINGNILTASIFGLNFQVDQSGAQITGIYNLPPIPLIAGSTSTSTSSSTPTTQTASIAVGDKISVTGSIDQSTGIIKATQIRDLSKETQSSSDIQSRIQQLLQMINQLRSQLGM